MVSIRLVGKDDIVMPLTVIGIKNAKPRAKPYKLTDSAALYLLVKPNGSKLWRMNYAHLKKHKTLAFGAWPEVSLARAREKRDRARSLIADGIDPGEEARLKRMRAVEQEENTFKSVAEEWFVKNEKEGRAPTTLRKIRWLLDKAYPTLGHRPIAKISAQEILFVLRKVESKGHYESARRMRSVLSRVLRYGIATARANRDVAADLRGALITPQVSHFAAITTSEKAAELLRAIEGYSGHVISCYALKLSPHLFVRPGELRKAEWCEFDFERAIWSIPAKKMKMGRPHKVPLSRQVLKLIGRLRMHSGDSPLLLPSFYRPGRPISENTVNLALRRLGFGRDEMTAHGFRAMAATLLNEMGIWNPDAIERQLAHMENNGVRRAYTRGEYWDERVRMMQHWSDYLDQLRDGARILRPAFRAANDHG